MVKNGICAERIPFFAASVAAHLIILLTLSLLPGPGPVNRNELFTVEFIPVPYRHDRPKQRRAKRDTKKPESKQPAREKSNVGKKNESAALQPDFKEATISLDAPAMHNSAYADYLSHVRGKIDSCWQYPPFAQDKGIEGALTLRFSIDARGRITAVQVLQPSEHPILDRESVRTVRAAGPFMPLPQKFNLDRLNILASFVYSYAGRQ